MRREVDSRALIDLAKEMEHCIYLSPKACARRHRQWARRIRSALWGRETSAQKSEAGNS